jgi:hypothetical protein
MHPEGGSWTEVRTHTPSKFSKVLTEPLAPIPLDHSKFRENGSQPPPNRTGYLSHHPALQFPCLFDFGLVKLALVFDNVQARVGSPHLAYLDVLSIGNLPHFAVGLLLLLYARVDGSPVC